MSGGNGHWCKWSYSHMYAEIRTVLLESRTQWCVSHASGKLTQDLISAELNDELYEGREKWDKITTWSTMNVLNKQWQTKRSPVVKRTNQLMNFKWRSMKLTKKSALNACKNCRWKATEIMTEIVKIQMTRNEIHLPGIKWEKGWRGYNL